jgi:uncharacterized protein YidB (DUF937 family)
VGVADIERESLMSLLDMVGSLFGKSDGDGQQNLAQTVIGYINNQPGGLNGLIKQFHEKGAGDVINSWVGSGPNQAISPDTLQNVLGSDAVKSMAEKVGISPENASGLLAQVLPHVVNSATPDGTPPADGQVDTQSVLGMVGQLFGKKEG